MATKKGGGSSTNGRTSNPKYLGLKKASGQKVVSGNIILRQKGEKIIAGPGARRGKDFTIYAIREGIVNFKRNYYKDKTAILIQDKDGEV